jgi:hypothetical protein
MGARSFGGAVLRWRSEESLPHEQLVVPIDAGADANGKDVTYLIFVTGNGAFDPDKGNFGECFAALPYLRGSARWRQSTPFAETSITVPGARIYL